MQKNYAMDDARWDKLIQDVAYYFDDLTLKRGFQYYKQKRVQPFTLTEPGRIRALVEGREDYRVDLDLDNLSVSRCDCPVHGPCKHMAAVLMIYADMQGQSVHTVANAKAAAQLLKPLSPGKPSLNGSKVNRDNQIRELAGQLPAGSLSEWREYFQLCTAPLAQSIKNTQYVDRALSEITRLQPQLSPVTQQLFTLHAQLFILETLTKPSGNYPGNAAFSSSLGYFTRVAADELQDAVIELLCEELTLSSEAEQWARVTETLSFLRREMLTESRDRSRDEPPFSICYDLLWARWIKPNTSGTELYSEELVQLRQAESELGASLSRHSWLLAQSRMHFYMGDDTTAWSLLSRASERPGLHPGELIRFLPPLSAAGDWLRLENWLAHVGPLLNSRMYNLAEYSGYWDEVVHHLPETEPRMWSTLIEMLPISRELYDEKLLSYGKWQEWMDYQLSSGKQPADFRVSDLQPLEKNAPEMLLPFYHQAAERFVLEKNRHSYKAAVKLLKRLSKLYKKLKRVDRWEQFLASFTSRHSRLRALHEELRKGKLIP